MGHSRSSSFNANHDQLTAVNALGTGTAASNTTTYVYDSSDNLTSAQLPTGATASTGVYTQHAGAYLPPSLKDPSGHQTNFTYDTAGNLTQSQDTSAGTGTTGAKLTYTYQGDSGVADCGGFPGQRCTSTDADNNTTHYAYDTAGNLITATPPAPLGATTYTYDSAGRQHTVTDGRGITTTYTYDNHDRTRQVTTSGGGAPALTVAYTYYGDGDLHTQSDASGTITYTYDALGREATRTLPGTIVFSSFYDPAGNLQTLTGPTGSTSYGYNAGNELTSLTDPSSGQTTFSYDNDGNRKTTTYPGGTSETATWDAADRPTGIKAVHGTTTLTDFTYSYAKAGADTGQIQTRTNGASGAVTTYTYDTQNRLNYAEEDSSTGTRSASWLYCHDAAGNLIATSTSASSCTASSGLTSYTYNAASELTATSGSTAGWSYDTDGNETAGNSATPRTAETYSALNQPTAQTTAGTTRTQTYAGTDSSDRLTQTGTSFTNGPEGLASVTNAGATTGLIRDPAGTLIGVTTGGATYYYLTDIQGSVLGLVNTAGTQTNSYAYDPAGNTRSGATATVTQPLGYTGAYLDPTGLYKLGARSYDPSLGRFTQPDPSGKETNPYLYAAGDPVNHTDPTGQFSIGDIGKDIAVIVGSGTAGAMLGSGIGCAVGFLVATLPGCAAGAAAGTALGGATGVLVGTGLVIAAG
nr:RHS repeat-associated core domain-containing protein [Streptomyces sp. SID4948]